MMATAPREAISVTLALGQSYQRTLDRRLLAAGMLRQVVQYRPHPQVWTVRDGRLQLTQRLLGESALCRTTWAIWKRLPSDLGVPPPITITAQFVDRFLVKWLEPTTIFHGYSGL